MFDTTRYKIQSYKKLYKNIILVLLSTTMLVHETKAEIMRSITNYNYANCNMLS